MTNFNDSRNNLEAQLSQFSNDFGSSALLRLLRSSLDTADFDQNSSEAQEFRTAQTRDDMKARDFRAAIGYERSRLVAADCGYTIDSWRQACANGFNIDLSRLACMIDALEALNKAEAAFVRAARKQINEVKP